MIDFLFVYEHKNREFESVCLIKAELELRGYSVDVVQVNSVKTLRYLLWKKPRVVIPFCLYSDKELCYNVYRIAGKIDKVVNIQWEQMLFEGMVEKRCGIPIENAIDATHMCWGVYSKKQLEKNGVKNAVVTGPVHMDLLQEKFVKDYLSREDLLEKYNIDPNKKVMVYISSFSYTTATERMIQYLKEFYDDESIDELCKLHRESKQKTLEWFDRLLEKDHNIVIIYRPHPSEFSDMCLEELEKKHKNFRVITDYSVKQWMLIADNNYTMFSTSIVEAFFAKKQCQIIRPVKIKEDLDYFFYRNAIEINTYSQFEESISNTDFKDFPIRSEYLNTCYEYTGDAYKKICDLLEEVYTTDKYDMNVDYNFSALMFQEIIKNIVKKFLLLTRFFERIYMKTTLKNTISEFYEIYDHSVKEAISNKEIKQKVEKMKKLIREE